MKSSQTDTREKKYIACPLCGGTRYEEAYRQWDETLRTTYTNVVCKDCGFMFRNPTLSAEGYAALYGDKNNLMSGSQFVNRAPNSRSNKLRDERLAFLKASLPLMGGSALDVGGGDGFLLEGFDAHAWKRVSVDPGERAALPSASMEFFHTGIEHFSYPHPFDIVLCISVLEHLRDPRAVIRKIYGLLSDTGVLMLEVPNSLVPAIKISEFYSFEHINGFTPDTLRFLLESEGFMVLAVDEHVSISNIRVIARKSDPQSVRTPQASEYGHVMKAVETYTRKKEEFREQIRRSLAPVFAPQQVGKVAVYGAGSHTLELLDVVDFSDSISCFLDSDPEKQGTTFLGKPVLSPDALGDSGAKLVVLSSGDYQAEMYERVRNFERDNDIRIISLYPEGTL